MKTTQREIQNLRLREIKANRKADGLCVTCAEKSRAGKVQCLKCSDVGKARYRESTGKPPLAKKKKEYKNAQTRLTGGVKRCELKDGYGRVGVYYMASAMIKGKPLSHKFSVDKYGAASAQLLASMQKMMWLVEYGVWNPTDGDPLALLSYTDSFSGNREYQDAEISNVTSPWIQEYEDVA